MRRWLNFLLAAVALLLCSGATAAAHGGDLTAIVSLQPLADRTAALSVTLQDAYGVKIPDAQLRASLRTDGALPPPGTATSESSSGAHVGQIELPEADLAILRLEVTILGDVWRAEFPVSVTTEVSEIGVTLLHPNAPDGAKSGTFNPRGALPSDPAQVLAILAVISLPVVLALFMQRRPAKK